MKAKQVLHCLILLLFVWSCHTLHRSDDGDVAVPEVVDFNFHVKPILSDRCFKCHGPDANQRKGDLRLDVAADAMAQTTNETSRAKWVIDPGSPARSEMIKRIQSEEPDYMMPPPESHLELTSTERAILTRWIDQGAEYKQHWSFLPPDPKSLPSVEDAAWAKNGIDHFVLQKLEQNGLTPAEQADKSMLLRRLCLDLTGLPPTEAQITAFLADEAPDAFERAVDTLLASVHYGERLALDWLDAARYADSHGYQDDGMRNTWPWRDWVIDAFNRDLPFDTFLLWQMAGDMLPDPTDEQLLATCFNRNHPQSQEGGVVDEEYRVEYVADRTNTLGKALLGLTLECARCHDHKYDPISQEDYYALYAFFNNNNDAGIVPYNGEAAPTLILCTEEAEKELEQIRQKASILEEKLTTSHYKEAFTSWASSLTTDRVERTLNEGLVADFSFEEAVHVMDNRLDLDGAKRKRGREAKMTYAHKNHAKGKLDAQIWGHLDDRPIAAEGKQGQGVQFVGDAGIRFNRDLDFDRHQPFSVSLWVRVLKDDVEGPVFGNTNGDFEGYRGWLCKINEDGTLSFQLNHVWPDNAIDFKTQDPIPVGEWVHLAMTYDGSSLAKGVGFYVNGERPEAQLFADNLQKSLMHGVKGSNWSDQPFLLGMELRKSVQDLVMDELKVYDRALSRIEVIHLAERPTTTAADDQPDDQLEWYLLSGQNEAYNQVLRDLTALRKEENLLLTDQPEVMIMQERKHLRPTYVLDRGAYDAPTTPVEPAVPQLLQIEDFEVTSDRLGLARWLIHPENPLTARVMVNRLWHLCFGKGLVATQEDFGSQGNLPSHPELLDYLALRFIELDWSVKALLKEIVLSATYQQSSSVSPAAQEVDPQNLLYAHYPAHRLGAEVIRDQALASSGLLVRTIGGPSVFPYQPPGIWKALATRNATEYVQQHGDSLYRRSMYTVWKRSSPPPAMLNFDAPDRYYCVVRRQQTTTPLQSLVLMNDPQFLEAARVLAERVLLQTDDPASVVSSVMRRLLGRAPRADETSTLIEQYEEALDQFERRPADARKLTAVGEYPINQSLESSALAAGTVVASTVMNFDEFVMKR